MRDVWTSAMLVFYRIRTVIIVLITDLKESTINCLLVWQMKWKINASFVLTAESID